MAVRQVPAAEFKAKRLRIIREMNGNGPPVTITNLGQAVALLSLIPAADEPPSPFIGMMRGTVLKHEDPLEPAASPSDWSALR